MTFKEIPGNEDVKRALSQMAESGRVPHALMFYENEGCGALALIQAFLQRLMCSNPSETDSCAVCPSCNKVSKFIHPDVHYVFPVNSGSKVAGAVKDLYSDLFLKWFRELASENPYFTESELSEALGIESKSSAIAVGEARRLLDKLSLTSVQGGYRAVVVYLPEKMNQEAANRLLKSIEEPPEKTLFLMITHSPEKVLQTISSRCQGIRVLPLSKGEIEDVLTQRFGKSSDDARAASEMCGGSVGLALKHLADAEDETIEKDIFNSLMDALVAKDLSAALEAGDAMASLDSREKQKAFCKFAGDCLRKLFMLQQGLPELAAIPSDEQAYYSDLAGRCRKSFPRGAMAQFDKAYMLLERNVSQKVLFCDLVNHLYFLI